METLLPLYQCHKRVRAAKIISVGSHCLALEGGILRSVPSTFIEKHRPDVGGYFVVYDDGYESYSPAAPFEAGYTAVGTA